MKQVMIGIFAHPDDESFGPSGTLMTLIEQQVDVHLILLTDGEAGTNPTNAPNLAQTRLDEWSRACELMGVKSTAPLHFPDGELSHGMYLAIGAALHAEVHRICESYAEPIELSFMSFEQGGVTGHLDHIAASYLTTHQFYSLKQDTPHQITLGEIWYFCLSREQAPHTEWTDYYMPIGRTEDYITRTVDVSSVLQRKYAVLDAHASQSRDAQNHKLLGDELLSREHFRVVT